MGLGGDLLSSLTGNTAKACLVVHDVRAKAKALQLQQQQLSALGSLNPLQSAQLGMITGTLQALQTGTRAAMNMAAADNTDKNFFVQFNPSSLQLYSTNIPNRHRDVSSTNEDQNTANDVVSAPRVELTVTLIFDKMNIYDAFMFDKFNTGVSATTVTNIATLATGSTFTVQPYVEGLISALRNPYTQSMTFQWADFSFTGRLRQLQAHYKMFSVSGRPIRAEVQLRLRQDLDPRDMQNWKTQFNNMLLQKSSLVTAGQKVSNLLNLSL